MSTIFWKNLQPDQCGSETATMCIKLLKDRLTNKISAEEFTKELAYVSIQDECLRDTEYKEPPPETLEVQSVVNLLEKEKVSLRTNEVLDMGAFHKAHPCLLDYQEKLTSHTRLNQRNAKELEDLHAFFKSEGDTVSVLKVYQAYQTFPRSLWVGNKMIWERKKL